MTYESSIFFGMTKYVEFCLVICFLLFCFFTLVHSNPLSFNIEGKVVPYLKWYSC